MIRRLAISVMMSVVFLSMKAQNIVSRLSEPDSVNYATVTVIDHTQHLYPASGGVDISGAIRGYRVNIFTDNSQQAYDSAKAAEARFKELFSDVPVEIKYDSPNFRVIAGNCITYEEAIMLWGRVNVAFDKAFIFNDEIRLSNLVLQQ